MRLHCSSFSELGNRIEYRKSRIVMFGAGVIGQITMPQILSKYGLLTYVDCYLDNDSDKWGGYIDVMEMHVPINSPEYLKECGENTVILLNISRYSDVVIQLQKMDCTEKMDCYIIPMMCIHNFCSEKSRGEPILLREPVIPKKIHYMWLGKSPLPESLQKCKESWKRFCPDYEIIEWNEDNYDIDRHPYMRQAYEAKAYGFVPDYARLDILYTEGGFYLDTDVEIKKNIDFLRFQEAFCGVEKWQVLNFGGLSGAVKGNSMVKRFLDAREKLVFCNDKYTCGFYDTKVALDCGYVIDGTTQSVNGMNIYASDYFHPYDYMSGLVNTTDNTYSVHWFNGGWLDECLKTANEEASRNYMAVYEKALNDEEI